MHRAGIFAIICLASLWMFSSAHAQDSSDVFLKAFQNYQTAEKMERESKPREALEKYKATVVLLEKIAKDSPDWQPLVIEYRLKKSRENVARLEGQVANMPAAPDSPEGPLPEADRSSSNYEPPVSYEPPVVSAPQTRRTPSRTADTYSSGSSLSSQDARDLRAQVAALRRDKEKLEEALLTEKAKTQSARTEIDKIKVNLVEFKTELAQTKSALEDAQKDQSFAGSERQQFLARATDLSKKLTDAQADNEVLADENNRLRTKVDLAAKYIDGSDTIRKTLLKERDDLVDAKNTALARTKRVKDNAAEIEKVTAENKTLKSKVADLEKSGASRAEVEKLAAENKALTDKLADAQLASVPKKEMEKLVAEKAELDKKYAEAEQQLKDVTAATPARDKLVASLQSELNSVNDRLLESQAQQTKAHDQVRDLQRQLDETSGELAKLKINGSSARDQRNLIAENDLLKGIILREIKAQTARDAAKKSMDEEIAKLQIKSSLINEQLAVLGEPTVQLSPEERSLFKEPMILLSEPNPESLQVDLTMTQPSDASPASSPVPAVSQGPESLPESARALVDQAKELFSARNPQVYPQVEKLYQQIVEEAPDNYFALSNLGAVQIEVGKFSAAEVALKRAIEINPGDAFAYRNLGIAYSRQGRFDEAVTALKQALAINDSDAVAHNYLGICLGQKGSPDAAEVELKRSVEIDPKYPDAHFNLAVLYVTNQPPSIDKAKEHYHQATELGASPDPSLERMMQ